MRLLFYIRREIIFLQPLEPLVSVDGVEEQRLFWILHTSSFGKRAQRGDNLILASIFFVNQECPTNGDRVAVVYDNPFYLSAGSKSRSPGCVEAQGTNVVHVFPK